MPLFADLNRLRAALDALRPLAPKQEARVLQKFRLEWKQPYAAQTQKPMKANYLPSKPTNFSQYK